MVEEKGKRIILKEKNSCLFVQVKLRNQTLLTFFMKNGKENLLVVSSFPCYFFPTFFHGI